MLRGLFSILMSGGQSREKRPAVKARGSRTHTAHTFKNSRPSDGLRIAEQRVEIKGPQHHVSAIKELVALDQNGQASRIRLEVEPDNPYDIKAVRIVTEAGQPIGYLDRETARSINRDPLPPVEAHRYFQRGKYVEVLIHILEPVPTKQEALEADRERLSNFDLATFEPNEEVAHSTYLEMARSLKRLRRLDEAVGLLERLIALPKRTHGAPPAAYLDLAKLYRAQKRSDDEVALIEAYLRDSPARGATTRQLQQRLEKLQSAGKR